MAVNELNPIGLITGYYEEEVEGLKPYEGIRQFTLLINYADYIYYIFEEIYITKPDGEGNTGDDEIDENVYRLIISTTDSEGNNISGVELSIKIGQYNPIRLNMTQSSITYYNASLVDGISVVVSGSKNNYSLIEEKIRIISSKITNIRLEFNYTGTSNEEDNVLKLGFKTNSIGTIVNVFVNNSESAFKTITLNTYSTTYINITNATSISYKATYNSSEGLEEKNGTINVFSGTYVVTLSFSYNNNGEETPDTPGGNQSTDVSGITLNKSNLTLSLNDTFQFIATVLPANATNKSVYWAISFDGGNTYTEVGLEENYSPEYYNITFVGVGSGWTSMGSINFSGNTFSNSIKRTNNSSEATVQFKVNCNITDINNLYIYYPSESVNIKLSTESSWDSDGAYALSKSDFGKTLDIKINQNTSSSSRELNIYASLEYNANWYGSLCRITQANSSSSSGGSESGGNEEYENMEAKIIWGDYGEIDEYYDTVFYGDTVRNIPVKVQSNCDWEFHDKYYYNNVTISPVSGSAGTTDITITTEAYDSGVPKLLTSTLYLVYNGNRINNKELDSIYRYQLAKNTTGSHSSYPQGYPVWISAQVIDGSSSNTSFNAMELNTYFAVYSFTECSVYTNDSWLSIVGQSTFGIGLHLFKVHGDANNTGSRRYGTIYAKVINNSRLNAEASISISQETNTSDALLEYRKIMLNPSEDTVTFDMYYSKSGTIKEEKSFYVYAGDPAQSSLTSLIETGTFPGTKTITITMDYGLTAIAIYDSDNNYFTATYIERISPWEVSYYDRLR